MLLIINVCPANTTRWNNDVSMLGQSRRRWANIKTTLFQGVVFAGWWELSSQKMPVADPEEGGGRVRGSWTPFSKTKLTLKIYQGSASILYTTLVNLECQPPPPIY